MHLYPKNLSVRLHFKVLTKGFLPGFSLSNVKSKVKYSSVGAGSRIVLTKIDNRLTF